MRHAIATAALVAAALFAGDARAQSTDPYLQDLREDGARTMMRTCHYELEILEIKGEQTTGGDWYACLSHYAKEASVRHREGAGYKMKAWPRTRVPAKGEGWK